MKTCKQCGAEDRPFLDALDEENGEPIQRIGHWVRPEIRFLKGTDQITTQQKRQGWFQRVIQGRPAIERDICMDCINANHIRRQLNAEQHRKAMALEREQGGEANFYLLLADVDGAY